MSDKNSVNRMKSNPFIRVMGLIALLQININAVANTSYIPEQVLQQVESLSREFGEILAIECNECYAKGCFHSTHHFYQQNSRPGQPGIPLPSQKWTKNQFVLTEAQCYLAYEDSLSKEQLKLLKKRLIAKLNRGSLKVVLNSTLLSASSPSLSFIPKEELIKRIPGELWQELRPHSYWILGLLFFTLNACVLIWAYRKLGLKKEISEPRPIAPPVGEIAETKSESIKPEEDKVLSAREQMAIIIKKDSLLWEQLKRKWLWEEKYDAFIHSLEILESENINALPESRELIPQKLKLLERIARSNGKPKQSESDFLNMFLKDWMLISETKNDSSYSIRELLSRLSGRGVSEILPHLSSVLSRVILCFMEKSQLQILLQYLSIAEKVRYLQNLLISDRCSVEDIEQVHQILRALSLGKKIDFEVYKQSEMDFHEGVRLEAKAALSEFLDSVSSEKRRELLHQAQTLHGGSPPLWLREVFFQDMLARIPDDLLKNYISKMNIEALGVWLELARNNQIENRIIGLAPAMIREGLLEARNHSKSMNEGLLEHNIEITEEEFARSIEVSRQKGEINYEQIF